MKKIIILIILISSFSYGQVPNTETFSFTDVNTEMGTDGENLDDLIELFASANSLGFNSSYEGTKNSLLNFRDYDHNVTTLTSFYISTTATVTGASACGATLVTEHWHDGSNAYAFTGDNVYTDSGGTTLYSGTTRWRNQSGGSPIQIISGEVTGIHLCN
jgi:hypothetical protein